MKHQFRFLAKLSSSDQSEWLIEGDELHHLQKVLRLNVGDVVDVFDGGGQFSSGSLSEINKNFATVNAQPPQIELLITPSIAIALGALKFGAIDDVLASLVELGADEILVFQQAHSGKDSLNEKIQSRWHRIILQACKQCKRARLPEIRVYGSLLELLKSFGSEKNLIITFDELAASQSPSASVMQNKERIVAVVGSEAGLTEAERHELAQFSPIPFKLGKHVLRAVTAAPAAAALLSFWRDQFSR